MSRCLSTALAVAALALPALSCAQVTRTLPIDSLRGEVTFGQPPEVMLKGESMRLSPGARIRDTNGMMVLSGSVAGQKLKVNYTLDPYGLLHNVWILTPDELARRWPSNAKEASTWTYDPINFTWIKP